MAATYSLPDIRDAVPPDFRVGLYFEEYNEIKKPLLFKRGSKNMVATYSLPNIRDAVPSDFRVGLYFEEYNEIKKPLLFRRGSKNMAATYSPALWCSTIGHKGLNFSVRNGKR